ncbi:PQQ-binding-like beta-propeller repeat protein [Paenibacillus sp. LHD-38]|uniref:outer membrane protein assembly factor BamB family protein n=1 Tax=Paenibacillus sp. LHD-38 TaxID=3072143 RepID=UPI00280D9179|nr:PQQ-binding-like beta-propeller repeat protein [Paenibacillus sp. LHD-38]MDQ8737688.1 PQQ-binding-like beta-propeller repeat protein [Paenibacillus sp. LHD-38]
MQRKLMFRTILTASALLIAIHIGQTADNIGMSQVYAENPVISFGIGNPGIQTPIVQPAWSAKVDNWEDYLTSNFTVTGEGKVFTLRDKRLIALNAQTGKTIWTFEDDVQSMFVYQEGNIYGALSDGSLFSLSASSGKKLWQSSVRIEKPNAIEVFGDTLYALIDNYTIAVHLKTGKQLWVNTDPQATYYTGSGIMDAGDIVLRTITMHEETQTTSQLNAIDKKTGKKLWGKTNQDVPFKIEGGLAYSIKHNNQQIVENPDRSITVSVINVKTGEVKGSRVYRWNVNVVSGDEYIANVPTYLDGNDFYIHQNGIIARYDFKNYKPDGKPMQTYSEPTYDRDSHPLNQVHRGRILFGNWQNGSLSSIKKVNGQQMSWTGDNPSAKTVIYGKGVYLAQTDGILHAIDFDSGKPLFRVKTGARQYDNLLKEDGFLIIQTPGKLIGVKLPAVLQ